MSDPVVIIVRHAEKPEPEGPHGVDHHGSPSGHGLTPRGWSRAGALAARMAQDGGTPAEQIARGCRLITHDEPPAPLVTSLLRLHDEALADYRARPDTAAALAPSPEAAALTLVANTLLNTDLALNR